MERALPDELFQRKTVHRYARATPGRLSRPAPFVRLRPRTPPNRPHPAAPLAQGRAVGAYRASNGPIPANQAPQGLRGATGQHRARMAPIRGRLGGWSVYALPRGTR